MKVQLSAGEFYVQVSGHEGASPIVLLHGTNSDSSAWEQVVGGFGERFRVYAVDQRGHGQSAWTPTYSFEEMRDDLLELVEKLELGEFLLCGHSMGGTVATLFAERYADRLSGLILVDSPPPDGEGEWKVPERPDEEPGFDWEVLPAIFGQLAKPDPAWWDELPAIAVPTLILGGGSTSPVPQGKLVEVADRIPAARLVTIEGAGHAIQRTRPTEFLAAVGEWLRDR
ncbi:alpha/beta fold hydrolase [Kribbella sp. NPDC051620]|uniref:alpha/beta fold hydrolase n=1 Tax=Kribbella sp. NPDC051620 TaxID=3364120 RepID=UPI0037B76886